jgi:F-type H+-transporting ATPase subunit delta
MNESKIAVRYAKALFLLALEKNILEQVRTDMESVNQAIKDFDQFGFYLKSPVVKSKQKFKLVEEVFRGKIDDTSLNFMGLLIQNKREIYLEDITRRFIDIYCTYKGIKSATITTASHLDESIKLKLKALLSSTYKTEIELQVQEEPSIIGGFILKIGDQQYDASIASGLKRMKTALTSGTI